MCKCCYLRRRKPNGKVCIRCRCRKGWDDFKVLNGKFNRFCNYCLELSTHNKKICAKCKEIKEYNDYNSDSSSIDGLDKYCKVCACIKQRNFNRKNSEMLKDKYRNRYKQDIEFRKNKISRSRQYSRDNKIKISLKNKKYRLENLQKVREGDKIRGAKKWKKQRVLLLIFNGIKKVR